MTGEYELAIIPGKIDLRSVSAYARMHSGATHPFSMYVDIITLNITHEFLRGTAFDKRDACTSLVRAYEYVQDGAASYDIDYVLVGCPVREILGNYRSLFSPIVVRFYGFWLRKGTVVSVQFRRIQTILPTKAVLSTVKTRVILGVCFTNIFH